MGSVYAIAGFLALILLVVIPIHELGHMLVARRFGFKVTEYFIGFGPRLWSRRRGEIEYGVKAIPAGGYVRIAGMNPYESVAPEDLPRAYGSKPIWQRTLVILAGPGSHFLMGARPLLRALRHVREPRHERSRRRRCRSDVGRRCVTREGSGPPGRRRRGASRRHVRTPRLIRSGRYVTRYAEEHPDEPLAYVVERDGGTITLRIVPKLVKEDGVTRGRIGFTLGPEPLSIPEAAVVSGRWVGRATWNSVAAIPKIFTQGVGRTFSVLFSDEPRRRRRPHEPGRGEPPDRRRG